MPENQSFLQDLLPYLLQRSSHLVTGHFHRHLQLGGVSVSRWRMLAWLSENQPYSVNQLADQLMLRQPTVTALVNMAVKDRLVVKQADPADARKAQIRLSTRGRKLALRLTEQARAAEADFIARFGGKRAAEIKTILRDLIRFAEMELDQKRQSQD